ncbi:MAG: bifunctional folylpolyglutamate synthase/dihydrofolate synthase [Flavobacteriaceae bacterium TMED81]|jgi:dihydrofolate synthase/folylpolyglutamate synthase|nr:MAG: bifunctional folylpolyglutamate synthase/dihydrofolate synthase [Flavobacteriaceae bacterium TMED81]|tara:strand:- start:73 stop:1278 length:1206 start_codon:yes stop_codon:yes gene_type:complete
MNYSQTLAWLFKRLPMYQRVGAPAMRLGLDQMNRLSAALGNPHHSLKCIHIAGTNGKGSTAHMLASVLQTAGYTVGLYTSPHVKDFRERIKINGQPIDKDIVVDFVNENFETLEARNYSFFEATVGMAFSSFAKTQVDVAIIEVGLGGRLDATNIITPILSIITHISKDHQQFLGNTVEAIAAEKAGIIKENVPVVLGQNKESVQKVILDKAKSLSSPVFFANQTEAYATDLLGDYQKENLATAYMALQALTEFDVNENHIREGLQAVAKNTGLQGRWQIIEDSPTVIADVAHNEAGIAVVMNQLQSMTYDHLHIVFGMVEDKDFKQIQQHLPKDATYYFCSPKVVRAKAVDQLFAETNRFGYNGKPYASVSDALHAAKTMASPSDIILVCGSLFVVAEVI